MWQYPYKDLPTGEISHQYPWYDGNSHPYCDGDHHLYCDGELTGNKAAVDVIAATHRLSPCNVPPIAPCTTDTTGLPARRE